MKKYILAIDQGTTGTTSILVDLENFSLVDKITIEFPQIYPVPGQVEHDLKTIWETVRQTVSQLIKKNGIQKNKISCIGITNQRETVCAFDNQGHPLANAIVWQDRRTSQYCKKLKEEGHEDLIKKKTGLTIDPYFSATKMRWYLDNNSLVQTHASRGNLHFGTIDTYLLFKLTGHKVFATEATNASRTLLYNLQSSDWDKDLLSLFQISKDFLPTIHDSFTLFGHTYGLDFLPDGIPITGILGDQQAALFGQAGIEKGSLKCTYGTGAFMLLNTGKEIQYSKKGLLTTVAYQYKNEKVYALEGSTYIAGAAVQWLRDGLNLISQSSEVESLARKIKSLSETEHLLFMPFFTGIGSPYWQPEAKGAILGITRDTTKAHIARACLEGISLSINDLFSAFKSDCPFQINSFKVDGGATANGLLLQIQANISKTKIIRPMIIETTAFGSALAAAIGVGALTISEIHQFWKEDKIFLPENEHHFYYENKTMNWEKNLKNLFLQN